MILCKETAQAVYLAMCTLDEIGAKLTTSFYERAEPVTVCERSGFIRVQVHGKDREVFETKTDFAYAYKLL